MAFDLDNLSVVAMGVAGSPSVYSYPAGTDTLASIVASGYFNDAVDQVKTGDRILISTSSSNAIANLSLSGKFRVNSTTHVVTVDFDNTQFRETQMVDISAAETIYLPAPPVGIITQVYGVQFSAITVASSIITFSIGATAITGGTLTITTSGVAGQLWTATPSALNVTDGTSTIKIVSDGGGTTTARGVFGVKIICGAAL